jgi:ComF family protein
MKSKLLEPIFDMFFPRRCMLCNNNYALDNLCESCRSRCFSCPLGSFGFSPEHKGALFYYELSIRDALRGAKFQRNYSLARLVNQILHEALEHNMHIERLRDFAPDAICYVPTHWMRRSLRGFDLPSSFAALIAQHLNKPLVHALTKTTLKKPQSSIQSKSSRLLAVKSMFKLRTQKKNYQKLVLIDDIVTTGATFDECTRVLKPIANKIICLAFAKTP